MIKYRVCDPKIALDARLYVPGWQLKGLLEDADKCVVAFYDDIPVGSMCMQGEGSWPGNVAMAFVRPAYRRLGIGSGMIKHFRRYICKDFSVYTGIKGSIKFWRKNDVNNLDD